MSVLLFSISSTLVLSKPRTNSDSNDGHATSPLYPPHTASRLVSGHCPPCLRSPPPPASPGSAWGVVRQPCSLHQLGESRRQPCILTSLALTSLGGCGSVYKTLETEERRASWGCKGVRCSSGLLLCQSVYCDVFLGPNSIDSHVYFTAQGLSASCLNDM